MIGKRLFCIVSCCCIILSIGTNSIANGFDEYQVSFKKSIGEWGDQCIKYVRFETGIEPECCNGAAQNCYNQAKACGYKTGDTPVIGSIMVMGAWSGSSVGHDAIVIAIDSNNSELVKVRDSNWGLDEKIQEHWIDASSNSYGWFKYVYPKNTNTSPQTEKEANTTAYANSGNLAWLPLGVECRNATKWIDIDTGNVVADKSIQSVSGDVVCESYGILPHCGIDSSPY